MTKIKRKKVLTTKNEYTAGCRWLTSVILGTWEAEIGRVAIGGQPRQILCKIPFPKWAEGLTHVIQHLLCKHESLSSNFSSPQHTHTYTHTNIHKHLGLSYTADENVL
jgi:hypothetical protein